MGLPLFLLYKYPSPHKVKGVASYFSFLTKIELTLEQSQQGVSNDVLESIEGVEELKRNVWIKGENGVAIPTLKAETGSIHMLSVFTKVNSGIEDKTSWTQ
nr:hypothetical protein [Tanacetum cinerariifolium]